MTAQTATPVKTTATRKPRASRAKAAASTTAPVTETVTETVTPVAETKPTPVRKPRASRAKAKPAPEQAAPETTPETTEDTPKPVRKPRAPRAKKVTEQPTETPQETTETTETPETPQEDTTPEQPQPVTNARSKAQAFWMVIAEQDAKQTNKDLHWRIETTMEDDLSTLTATRGTDGSESFEQIYLVWTLGDRQVYGYDTSLYTRGNREWTIRNVSEARKIVRGEIKKGSDTPRATRGPRTRNLAEPVGGTRTTANRTRRTSSDPGDAPRKNVPFNLDADSNERILEMLEGKKITWRVSGTSTVKDGICYPGKNLKITESKQNGRKIVHFADQEGFKTAYLDAILSVSK